MTNSIPTLRCELSATACREGRTVLVVARDGACAQAETTDHQGEEPVQCNVCQSNMSAMMDPSAGRFSFTPSGLRVSSWEMWMPKCEGSL